MHLRSSKDDEIGYNLKETNKSISSTLPVEEWFGIERLSAVEAIVHVLRFILPF